jgi:hypothetical protein
MKKVPSVSSQLPCAVLERATRPTTIAKNNLRERLIFSVLRKGGEGTV